MKKTQLTPEQKVAIILQSIKGEMSIAQLCREHGIHESLYYKWRDRFLKAGKEGLARNGKASSEVQQLRSRVKYLEQLLGRLTVEIEILKKNERLMER